MTTVQGEEPTPEDEAQPDAGSSNADRAEEREEPAKKSRLLRVKAWLKGWAPTAAGPYYPAPTARYYSVQTIAPPMVGYGPVIGIVCANGPRGVKDYVESIEMTGGIPLLIPLISDTARMEQLYRSCDGLVFPGGRDVDPARYGEEVQEKCEVQPPDLPLDLTELKLLQWAIADKVPFLAVCRGMQVLNVERGGTLWQDLNVQHATKKHHRIDKSARHLAELAEGSHLRRIAHAKAMWVNSLHHQALKTLGEGMRVTATSPDGVIEGVELTDHPFGLGVQFHPEMVSNYTQWAYDLFHALIEAAASAKRPVERPQRENPQQPKRLWWPAGEAHQDPMSV